MIERRPFIWVESLMGGGKTTLIQFLEQQLNLRAFYEPFQDNPYFEDSYKDPKAYAFKAQMFWAMKRAEIHELATAETLFGDTYDGVMIDRGLPGDKAFFEIQCRLGNIEDRDRLMYMLMYNRLINRPKAPTLMLYLDVEPEVALRRIKDRNREAESLVKIEYLRMLRDAYYDILVELGSGQHEWSGRTEILKIPYNVDNKDPKEIVDILKDKYPILRK